MKKFKEVSGITAVALTVALFPVMTAQAGMADPAESPSVILIKLGGLAVVLAVLALMDRYLWPHLATRNSR